MKAITVKPIPPKENQAIRVKVYDQKIKDSVWLDGICTGTVSAIDRAYRVNVRLNDGREFRECAPECVRVVNVIVGKISNKNLYFCNYNQSLDKAIENFKSARTVKVLKNVCYIHRSSLGYFTELLSRDKVPFKIITTLV